MKRTCAWCGGDLGSAPPFDEEDTYGLCDDCGMWVSRSADDLHEELGTRCAEVTKKQATINKLIRHIQRRRKGSGNTAAIS